MSHSVFDNKTLLECEDPTPFEIYNGDGSAQGIILADHASNYIPPHMNNLGLSGEMLNRHIAYDIGTDLLTRRLAERLDMRALIANYSRLIVDINRHYDHKTLIPETGEGKPIPGNQNLDRQDRESRLNEIYEPYHHKLDEMVATFTNRNQVPVLISLHSFNREFFNALRPWEIGVMWARDRRIAEQVYDYFHARGYCVGDNKPYDLRMLSGSTTSRHGDDCALPNVLIEIRNDLLDTQAQIDRWAEKLANCMESILANPAIYSYCQAPEFIHDIARENTYFEELIEKAKRGEVI